MPQDKESGVVIDAGFRLDDLSDCPCHKAGCQRKPGAASLHAMCAAWRLASIAEPKDKSVGSRDDEGAYRCPVSPHESELFERCFQRAIPGRQERRGSSFWEAVVDCLFGVSQSRALALARGLSVWLAVVRAPVGPPSRLLSCLKRPRSV